MYTLKGIGVGFALCSSKWLRERAYMAYYNGVERTMDQPVMMYSSGSPLLQRLRATLKSEFVILIMVVSMIITSAAMAQDTTQGEFIGAMQTELPDWFKESFLEFEDDIDDATAAGKRLMLYFHQDNCPYCNALIEHNFELADIKEQARSNLDVVAINMFGDRDVVNVGGKTFTEKTLAQALRVNYTPTLLFFNEQREVALRLDGYYPPKQFRIALDYVTQRKDREVSYQRYLETVMPPASTGNLQAESFFMAAPYDLDRRGSGEIRPLAVFFEQKQCEECTLLHTNTLSDPITRDLIEQFDAVQLDMWSNDEIVTPAGETMTVREWAAALGLKFAPSIVLFDGNGVEVMRSDAFLKTFHIQSVLDYVLTGAYKQQPNFQRFISARSEALRERGVTVDIWSY